MQRNDHGGELALSVLRNQGVDTIYTLSGGHIFPFYDAAAKRDPNVRILDTRHEQTATFAAEAAAKLTRNVGVAVLTAGPGVTNGVSAITSAQFNGSPVLVLGGRAPQARWGAGSLQEFDHIPLLSPITKLAATVTATDRIAADTADAVRRALTPHRGPVFLDFPLDVVFGTGESEIPDAVHPAGVEPDPDAVRRAGELLATAERPAIIAGSDVWWNGADQALVAAAEALRVPVFLNGLGRGCVPADHELCFSRTRKLLKTDADVVVVIGTPLDFRLSFGNFGDAAVVHVTDHPSLEPSHVEPAVQVSGDLTTVLRAWADHAGQRSDHEPWLAKLTDAEAAARSDDAPLLAAADDPIKPTRIYGELARRLDRDAVVVCDGGDFVSYAGKYVDVQTPGSWLDTGPFGCLGTGMGGAIAARVTHPDRQVVVLLGDGAAGFSLMDVDTLVRHDLPVVMVVGNNGIWGLEKHPMQALYGYDVAADLQAGCRYDEVVIALGGAGETVTDPADAYPRSSNLA